MCAVGCFKEHHTDTNLTPTIEAFEVSTERQTLVDYCSYVFEDVRKIFVDDNILQNNTDVERSATICDNDKRTVPLSATSCDSEQRRVKPQLA